MSISRTFAVEFQTSTLASLYSKQSGGTDIPGLTFKLYDANDAEITASENQGQCVKTVVTYEPTFSYRIVEAKFFQKAIPASDLRLWELVAPDIPAQYGGSFEAFQGVNFAYLPANSGVGYETKSAPTLYYDATNHTGKIAAVFKHVAGLQHSLMLTLQIEVIQ